jgi:hypothetical protein
VGGRCGVLDDGLTCMSMLASWAQMNCDGLDLKSYVLYAIQFVNGMIGRTPHDHEHAQCVDRCF